LLENKDFPEQISACPGLILAQFADYGSMNYHRKVNSEAFSQKETNLLYYTYQWLHLCLKSQVGQLDTSAGIHSLDSSYHCHAVS